MSSSSVFSILSPTHKFFYRASYSYFFVGKTFGLLWFPPLPLKNKNSIILNIILLFIYHKNYIGTCYYYYTLM